MSSHYEKIGDEVRCIGEEIPFEIPESWAWCRLGNIVQHNTGKTLDKGRNKGTLHRYITTSNLYWGYFDLTELRQMPFNDEELDRCTAIKGDLLVCEGGEAGRSAIWESEKPICFQNHIHRVRPFAKISPYYILLYIEKIYLTGEINNYRKGVGIQGLSGNSLSSILITLPPLNEQQRIIKRIQSIDNLIAKYDKQEKEIYQLNTDFPEKLKKSILQYAIQGKLVAQNPDDEPVSVLLEKIRLEKQKLIKAGKIKPDKPDKNESFIYKNTEDNSYYESCNGNALCIDDQIPFAIPNNWAWARLKNIVQFNPTNKADDNINASFVTMKNIEAGYSNSFTFEGKEWGKIKKGFTHFQNGDVAFAKITPCFQNRKSLIFNNLINNIGAGTTELHILRPIAEYINPFYLLIFVKTEYFIKYGITNFTGTAGQQRFPIDKLKDILIPLPPNYEQKRIAEKVKLLFSLFH